MHRARRPRHRRRALPAPAENPEGFWTLIAASWKRRDPTLYGRIDLRFDGNGPAKLLEYNADTPTSLFEAAVFQWTWLEQAAERQIIPRDADQYNSIHERLIEAWRKVGAGRHLHLSGILSNVEDAGTLQYLEDVARQAGLDTTMLDIEQVGLRDNGAFVDMDERDIELAFKLYPWEWMFRETFGARLKGSSTRWIEPPWKAILSNKGILPLLWAMFPNHPNLLPAFFEDDPNAAKLGTSYVRKPLFSREGANVTLVSGGEALEQHEGPYGAEGFIRQALAPLPNSRTSIPCSAAGSSTARRADCRSARTKTRSPATLRASSRTRLFRSLPQETAPPPPRTRHQASAACLP